MNIVKGWQKVEPLVIFKDVVYATFLTPLHLIIFNLNNDSYI